MTTTKGRAPSRRTIADDLRAEVLGSGWTAYGLGKAAGVDPGVISRFTSGERDVTLTTAGRLADALGLRLVGGAARGRGRPRKPGRPAQAPETSHGPEAQRSDDPPTGATPVPPDGPAEGD